MIHWYMPSFYGDIKLESQGEERTMLTLHGLSPEEEHAMEILVERARRGGVFKRPWASTSSLEALNLKNTVSEQKLLLSAPISEVHKVLAKALKPGRKKLTAVTFSGGKIQELTASNQGLIEVAAREERSSPKATLATVAEPVRGCPEPDFTPADVRASAVLREFLTARQQVDFNEHQSFIAVGADTGHRYQLTSRHCRSKLVTVRRTLFDLDEQRPLCVHDWDVPASEELLAILLCLSLPGRESYVRTLPEMH